MELWLAAPKDGACDSFHKPFSVSIDRSSLINGELGEADAISPCKRKMRRMHRSSDAESSGLECCWNAAKSRASKLTCWSRNGSELSIWAEREGRGAENDPSIILIFSEIPRRQLFRDCIPPPLERHESVATGASGKWSAPWRAKPAKIEKWEIRKGARRHDITHDAAARARRAGFASIYGRERAAMEEELRLLLRAGIFEPLESLPTHKSARLKIDHSSLTKPDRAIFIDGKEKCSVEAKTSKAFPGEDWSAIESYAADLTKRAALPGGALPLGQIFSYMVERMRAHGALASYQRALLLKISFAPEGERALHISEPIHHSLSDPGALQAFSCFLCAIQADAAGEGALKCRRSSNVSSSSKGAEGEDSSKRGRKRKSKKRKAASRSRAAGYRRCASAPSDARSDEEEPQAFIKAAEERALREAAEEALSEGYSLEDFWGSELECFPLTAVEEEARRRKEKSRIPGALEPRSC